MSLLSRETVIGALVSAAIAPSIADANEASDRLAALSEKDRRAMLSRYMRASDEACGAVTRTFYQGAAANGDAIWNLSCANGKSFAFLIKNDAEGSTQILGCGMLKLLKAGECFKKF